MLLIIRQTYSVALLAVILALPLRVSAELQLNDSRTWRRAKMVAGGQQVWSFRSSFQKATDRFSNNGRIEPLGDRYARSLTWGEILTAEQSTVRRNEIAQYMRDQGAGENDVAATSTYELERQDIGFSVDWAYGLTSRWSIGFQLPLVLRQTRVRSDVQMMPALAQSASKVRAMALSSSELKSKVRELAERQLSSSGFDDIPEEQQEWTWGDVSLLSQFYLLSTPDWDWSLQQMLRFPSSRNPSVADYFQQSSDEGQMDLGLTSLVDYRLKRWVFGARLGYVAQLPDAAKMRAPEESAQIDPKVNRDLGDWIWGAFDVDYRVDSRFLVDIEYAFLAKSADSYSGHSLKAGEYELLSKDTEQEVHQTRVGLQYDLGERSLRRGVENKWIASIGYTYPWIGKNSADASRTSLELISYF